MENFLLLLPNRPQSVLIRYGVTTLIVRPSVGQVTV
jgi:hypothetical protein